MRRTWRSLLLGTAGGLSLFVLLAATVSSVAAQIDPRFATPERALDTYINALRQGDLLTVTECFNPANSYDLPAPIPIESYRIVRKVVVDAVRVRRLNSMGNPRVKARKGDIELHVQQTISGKATMYSYVLRLREDGWRIYEFSAANGEL